jgi:hypothetical protein
MKILNIHANCVRLGRAGVLLLGPSGSGKSDLALRLIAQGARLVSDDRSELFLRGGKLCARPPKALAGLLEIRGLGIVAHPHAAAATIALAVRLGEEPPRLPRPRRYTGAMALGRHAPVPLLSLDGFQASAPAKIAAALKAYARDLFRDNANAK